MLALHSSNKVAGDPTTHTRQPIVTGSSVLAVKYDKGVMIAADTLASYGSLARYKDVRRIIKVGDRTIMGASGEMSDFQAIQSMMDNQYQSDLNEDDGYTRSPSEVHNYMRAVMYQRRNKMNPLWNQLVVGGFSDGKPYLGFVDMIGTSFEEDFLATGFGGYLALPIIRERWRADMTETEARKLLEDCLRVCFYRDCRSSSRILVAKATAEGTEIMEPYEVGTDWNVANFDRDHNVPSGMDGSSW